MLRQTQWGPAWRIESEGAASTRCENTIALLRRMGRHLTERKPISSLVFAEFRDIPTRHRSMQ